MPLKSTNRSCPVCAKTEAEFLHHQKFALPEGHILPAAYDVVWCPDCGFAYADTGATQEVYDRYYGAFSKYEDNASSTGGGASEWDARRLRDTAAAIAQAIGDPGRRILDIGCANGGLLAELRKLGFHSLVGADPSAACVANTRREHGIDAHIGFIGNMPEAIGKFDLVILSHVLEHVLDLQSTVSHLRALLTERGMLYIEVPDASRYSEFMLAPFQDFNTEHINHFSVASLRNLFGQHGFTSESCGQKEIDSSPGCPYPAAYCFFRHDDQESITSRQYELDESFRAGLLHYVERSREKLAAIEQRIAPFCSADQPVIVWGAGQLAMKLLAETSLGRARIAAFVDTNPIYHGKRIAGTNIIAPNDINDAARPIIIATLLHQREITDAIRTKFRLSNPIVTLDS